MQTIESLSAALGRYRDKWPGEAQTVDAFEQLLRSSAAAFERSGMPGHFTGSAWLVSADGERVLLMHHHKLDRWLQPGGHADGEMDLASVALREAREETGLQRLRADEAIFDIDRHVIPPRGDEPQHWHHDVRYVVHAMDERYAGNHESRALAWRPVAEVVVDDRLDPSLQRMARKWLER